MELISSGSWISAHFGVQIYPRLWHDPGPEMCLCPNGFTRRGVRPAITNTRRDHRIPQYYFYLCCQVNTRKSQNEIFGPDANLKSI